MNTKYNNAKVKEIINSGNFLAAQVPWYLDINNNLDTYPLILEFTDSVKLEHNTLKNLINIGINEYMLDIKPGSWLVTSYNVPNDIAVPASKEFNWDHIYVINFEDHDEKIVEFYNYLNYSKGTDVRYGLPVGEQFIKPKKRQYYGHPGLYNSETGQAYKNLSQSRKRHMKKNYEMNQLRILNLENSLLNFKNFTYSKWDAAHFV